MKQYPQKFFAWIALFLLFTAGTDFAHAASISKVETGNVTPSSFTVFWQATKNADPNIKIYSDFTGTDELNGRIRIEYFPLSTGDLTLETSHTDRTERRSLQNALKENGLFLARISNLNPNTRYYLAVEAAAAGETARFPQEDLLEVKTSHQTAFIRESLQIAIEFPGDNNGLVASLSTPDAANPLFATVGDSGFSNKAFFNLSDFIDPTTGTNLEPTNNLPLTVHLYLPDAPAESDEDQQVEFEQSFVVAKTIDLFFTGTGAPRVVRSFAFDLIGTQTADIPFKITLRALDSMGNPMSDFNDSAQLSASGAEVEGIGTTPSFVDGVLENHPITFKESGEFLLTIELADGSAKSDSPPFRVTASFDHWLSRLFTDPDDRDDPALTDPQADPFGTGIANLLAYALGIDPAFPDRQKLPLPFLHTTGDSGTSGTSGTPRITADNGETYLAITYPRPKGTSGIDYIPEVSSHLTGWQSGPESIVEIDAVDKGDHELVTVRDRVPFSADNRRFMRLRILSESSFSSWQYTYFNGEDFNDPAISGDDADPAGDGISNLMKYALGLDPFEDGTADLPKDSSVDVDEEDFLILSYLRPKNRTDIDYVVELSDNMTDWYPGGSRIETLFAVDRDPNELIIVRDIQPLAENEQRGIRLNVKRR